jgi:sulfite reductase (ferredoxin)
MSFYKLPDNLKEEIQALAALVKKYKAGTLASVKLKAVRVPFGIYEQREPETYMCRIRLPGGAITPKQLIGVAKLAKKYSDRPLHFTTRQEVQIHHVKLEDAVKILNELFPLGLSTRGGGGNTVRNIISSVTSDVFDIAPYVQALTSRMIAEKDSWELPRKLKIAFSDGPEDKGLATTNDLGFIAKKDKKGNKGFSVYIAGGLGAKPQVATLLYKFVSDDQVYNIAKAAKLLFDKYGNRKNKYAARMRFLLNKLGRDKFFKHFEEELAAVRQKNYPPLAIEESASSKVESILFPLFLGDVETKQAKQLGEILLPLGEDTIRATIDQNLELRNVPEAKIEKIIQKLPPLMPQAVACAGASTCRLGICLSRGLLEAVKSKFEEEGVVPGKIDDIKLKISGCPNNCGQHHIADIGLYGVAKRFHNRLVPCYTLLLGGVVKEGQTRLAEKAAVIPAINIPDFLVELIAFVKKNRKAKETFAEFLNRIGKAKIAEIVNKYTDVPDKKEFYIDWGTEEVFSVASKLEGECSAGLFDLIEWDFGNIDKAFSELERKEDSQPLLRSIIVSAARALLVTKGLEPKDEKEAVKLFIEYFIEKHVDKAFKKVADKYLRGENISLEEAQELSNAVRKLYDAMDNSLKFPEIQPGEAVKVEELPDKEQVFRDYRGVACPMNFVKTKLVLETMKTGEKLQILLDDGEPIDNVPGSVKAEGHKVLKQEKVGSHWSVVIEKSE